MNAYKLAISNSAETIKINSLNDEFKNQIINANQYAINFETHDLYKIPIGIEFIELNSNRKSKRFSIEKTDKIFIEVKMPDDRILLSGIYPTTTLMDGQTTFDYEGEAVFELNLAFLKFKIGGKFKNKITKNKYEIFASRVPPLAQWIYTKSFIVSGKSFDNFIVCSVPKNMEAHNRYVICNVESKDRNRTISKIIDKRVRLL